MKEQEYMRRAIELAKKGCGMVAPNPMVGSVIVKDGEIIGEGYHAMWGGLHAERNALKDCRERGNQPENATMYVTLEPCSHHGKQPPCVEAILEAKIGRVVIGSDDPNPLVAGKGIAWLQAESVEVETGLLKEECDALNQVFFHYIRTKYPYVVMKYAMTIDGKIATRTGASQWITGERARQKVHEDRHRYSAIMVGIGTVLQDDPLLTCRIDGGKNPIRIVGDTHLRTPLTSQIVMTAEQVPTMIATCCSDPHRIVDYENAGCQVLVLPMKNGCVDLKQLMKILGENGIDSILLEGVEKDAVKAGVLKLLKEKYGMEPKTE